MKNFFRGMNKGETVQEVKSRLRSHPHGVEFEDEFITELMATHHYGCVANNSAPLKFKVGIGEYQEPTQWAFFSDFGWKKFSYKKCVTPPTMKSKISQALRDKTGTHTESHRTNHPICEQCGVKKSHDVHHSGVKHSNMVNRAMALTPKSELDKLKFSYDWTHEHDFFIPSSNQLWVEFEKIYKDEVKLVALCEGCHDDTHRGLIDEIDITRRPKRGKFVDPEWDDCELDGSYLQMCSSCGEYEWDLTNHRCDHDDI